MTTYKKSFDELVEAAIEESLMRLGKEIYVVWSNTEGHGFTNTGVPVWTDCWETLAVCVDGEFSEL